MIACHGVPCASAASQAMATAEVSTATRFERGRPICCGTTPFAACGRGNCPRREITVTLPWNPSRRALEQHVDHGQARADQRHRLGVCQPVAGQDIERRKRAIAG